MNTYETDGATTLNNTSNIHHDDVGFEARDVAVERAESGQFTKVSTAGMAERMNAGDTNVVLRDGFPVEVGNASYQDTDIVTISGMQMDVATAKSMGLLGQNPSEQVAPQLQMSPEDMVDNAVQNDIVEALDGTDLIVESWNMQTEGKGLETLNDFAADFVENGELTEASFEKALSNHGLGEGIMREQFAQITDAGNQNVYNALEVGDDLGIERMEFLREVHDTGTAADAKLVRGLMAGAALGHLSGPEVVDHFDRLYAKYTGE